MSSVHAMPSSQLSAEPSHTPAPHTSLIVHTFPSSQVAEFGAFTQPSVALHESSVHGLPSSHATAAWKPPPSLLHANQSCPSHLDFPHKSAAQTLVAVQYWFAGQSALVSQSTQMPAATLQTSGQPLLDVQALAVTHAESTHACPVAQSPLAVQSTQTPSFLSHTWPVALQLRSDVQSGAALQVWFWQRNPLPQSLPCVHVTHTPVVKSHTPAAHAWLTSHGTAAQRPLMPCVQPLVVHASVVHKSLSSQAELLGVCTQPLAGLQLSVVQATPSSQLMLAPAQTPDVHASLAVQALPSLHATVAAQVPAPQLADASCTHCASHNVAQQ